jgi:hypothetical protein
VETLEVTRWLGCRNLRGHRCRGRRIEIPLVVAISDSSPDSNFNNHTGTGISDSSPDGNFNNHTGTNLRDSSSGGTSGYTATGSSDSSSYHNTNGRNAGDSCNSFDNFEHSS